MQASFHQGAGLAGGSKIGRNTSGLLGIDACAASIAPISASSLQG
jgi:hypothetical protein